MISIKKNKHITATIKSIRIEGASTILTVEIRAGKETLQTTIPIKTDKLVKMTDKELSDFIKKEATKVLTINKLRNMVVDIS